MAGPNKWDLREKGKSVARMWTAGISAKGPLLAESLRYFKSIGPDLYSRLGPGRTPCVDVCVSKPSLERALFLMHTLFRFLEAQGFTIHFEARYGMSTFVN